MRLKICILVILSLFIGSSMGFSAEKQNMGKAEMELYGGKSGNVPFPHQKHQKSIDDCMVCHDVFPQEEGSIEKLKAEGKLKAKKVMNVQCLKCHRKNKKAGSPSGPTSCAKCHSIKTKKSK